MIQSGNLYADLSVYYDLFCAEIDYAEQCAFARRVFDIFANSEGCQYLDLACGTGAHIRLMQSLGFDATGLDNSAEMLQQAAARCPEARFLLSNMSALQSSNDYDLVSCFLYSIHYSQPVSALQKTLDCVFRALRPGGVFMFNTVDINGINSRHFVTTQVNTGTASLSFRSGWTYSGQGEVMDLLLSITEETPGSEAEVVNKRVWQDRHTMAAVRTLDMVRWLEKAGFEVTLLEHDYSRVQLWSGDSFNVIVVACKPHQIAA